MAARIYKYTFLNFCLITLILLLFRVANLYFTQNKHKKPGNYIPCNHLILKNNIILIYLDDIIFYRYHPYYSCTMKYWYDINTISVTLTFLILTLKSLLQIITKTTADRNPPVPEGRPFFVKIKCTHVAPALWYDRFPVIPALTSGILYQHTNRFQLRGKCNDQ